MSLDVDKIDEERFWSFVQRGDINECWPWIGSRFRYGYGRYNQDGGQYYAHQIAWTLSRGAPMGPGLVHRHTCDVTYCCNPSHLISGTQADNVRDMFARHRRIHTANGERHPKSRLTWAIVNDMRQMYDAGYKCAEVARYFNLTFSNTRMVVKRIQWKGDQ